jgi:hypothetical protein
MPQMEVIITDAFIPNVSPGPQGDWFWPNAWEYVSLTVIPISSNGDMEITRVHATSDAGSNRDVHFEWQNNTGTPLDCFLTLTTPASPVA